MIKKILLLFDIRTTNDKLLLVLSFLLFLPLFLDYISAVTYGGSGIYSIIIYGISAVIVLFSFRKLILPRNIFLVLGIYIIFAINALFFPTSRDYIINPEMFIVYGYFIPISFIIITRITDWGPFFRILAYFGVISIFMAARIILYVISIPDLQDEGVFSYMEFSYALSPMLCAMFARYLESNKYIYLIAFLLGMLEMFAYSSRAALLFTLVFVVVAGLYYFPKRKGRTLLFIVFVGVMTLFSTSIINKMEDSEYFEASYVLKRLLSGELSGSNTRNDIYSLCRRRVNEVGVDVNGLFGDRPYCGSVYPHNLIYEIYMQMGYIIGSIVLLLFGLLICSALFRSSHKLVVIFFLLTILAKFFVSDSYLINGKFWILIGVLVSLSQKHPLNYENSVIKRNLSRA